MARKRIPIFATSGGVIIAKPNLQPLPNLVAIFQTKLSQLTSPS